MEDIGIYEVSECYVDYLAPLAPHLFLNQHKVKNGMSTRLAARCNDFKVLETACKEFM